MLKITIPFLILIFSIAACVHDPISSPPELASGLKYSPDSLAVEIGTAATSEKPEISGTSPFSFNIITEPSSDGNISITSEGIIQVSENITEGNYLIDVIVLNDAGSVEFPAVFTLRAFSIPDPPSQLLYTPATATILSGSSFTSGSPELQGTPPFTFSISDNPEPGIITIDNQGVISSSSTLEIGSYNLNIEVSNEAATEVFNTAFTLTVSSSAVAPSNLSYSINSLVLTEGTTGSSVSPTINGTAPFVFNITSVPNAGGNITIDNSGVITASNTLDTGSFDISVNVGNSVDTVLFTNVYTITVNPTPSVTFQNDVRPLILQRCSSCHTGGSQLNFTVYANASANINSILGRVQRPQGTTGFMPQSGAPLSSAEIQLLQDWLDDGLLQ